MRLFLLTALLATADLTAQVQLTGLTAQIPGLLRRNQTACTDTLCTPGFPQTVGLPYLGGTGWDPVRSGAWISNGPLIACVDDTCNFLCAASPTPTPGLITGLEVIESQNEIWATDSLSNIVRMTRTCPPTLIGSCNTGIVPTATRGLSGLAVDEGRQLVFYCGGDWATGTSQLRVAMMATPCTPFHQQPVTSTCPPLLLRPLTGLAVDWGNQVLYMTDGIQTIGWNYVFNSSGPSIAFTPASCCQNFFGDTLVGLAVRPNPAVPLGAPCAVGCATCAMQHVLVGDPNLGNAGFGLALNGAPAGSIAICCLQLGSCISPGTLIPGLCGPLWMTVPLWGNSPPLPVPGTSGCSPGVVWNLPLPAVTWLAGLPVASQYVALCTGGTTMSNCLSWVLQGN